MNGNGVSTLVHVPRYMVARVQREIILSKEIVLLFHHYSTSVAITKYFLY